MNITLRARGGGKATPQWLYRFFSIAGGDFTVYMYNIIPLPQKFQFGVKELWDGFRRVGKQKLARIPALILIAILLSTGFLRFLLNFFFFFFKKGWKKRIC